MSSYILINTAGKTVEILLKKENKFFYDTCEKLQASITLLPKIDEILDRASVSLKEIECFGCVIGPGSFTGIRIGVTTIRAFAYSLNKKVFSLTYFDILRQNSKKDCIITAIDGSNGVIYVTGFKENRLIFNPKCILVSDLDLLITESKAEAVITDFKYKYIYREPNMYDLSLAAEKKIKESDFIDYNDLIPYYIRKSQPERQEGEL